MKKTRLLILSMFCFALTEFGFGQNPTLELDKVLIQSTNMGQPWGMCFLNSNELLLTEKSGKLFTELFEGAEGLNSFTIVPTA